MLDTNKVRTLRESKKLSMAAAAKAAGISSPQAWEKIENGDGLSLTLTTLNRIAEGLGVAVPDLLIPTKTKTAR